MPPMMLRQWGRWRSDSSSLRIRSDSLTIPTTRRSSSTTAIALLSVFANSSIALRASASGETVGTDLSMISAGVFIPARLFDGEVWRHPHRDRVDHVGGDHRLGGADTGAGIAAGAGMGDDRRAGRGKGLEAASEHRRSDAGEHVPSAGGGEGGGGKGVDGDPPAVGDDRVVAL